MNHEPRVVLLFPSPLENGGYSLEMPLSVLSLAAPLHHDGYQVTLIDERLQRDPEDALLEAAAGALCVGVSSITGYQLRRSVELMQHLRRSLPTVPIIWGGYHPSLFPDDCAAQPYVDAVVRGQGERPMQELVARLQTGLDFSGIPNVTWRADDGAVITNPSQPMTELAGFPPAPYELLDVERFFEANGGRRALQYVSSQGCSCKCTYCVEPRVYGRWSGRTAAQMVDELEALNDSFGLEHVSFADANFFLDRHRIENFCRLMIERDVRISWSGTARADQAEKLPEELTGLMREAGCTQIAIGVESGSQQILDFVRKKSTPKKALKSNQVLQEAGIQGLYAFMVGFPKELAVSEDEIWQTLMLIKQLRRAHPEVITVTFFVTPYPGTPIFDMAETLRLDMPQKLEDWAAWESTSVSTDWISDSEKDLVERCNNFYFLFAYPNSQIRRRMSQLKWKPFLLPLHWMASMRCRLDFYRLPLEWRLVSALSRRKGMRLRRASSQIDALRGYGGQEAQKLALLICAAADVSSDLADLVAAAPLI